MHFNERFLKILKVWLALVLLLLHSIEHYISILIMFLQFNPYIIIFYTALFLHLVTGFPYSLVPFLYVPWSF